MVQDWKSIGGNHMILNIAYVSLTLAHKMQRPF
uniref:Uncharacterized protein n=1 Tax=Arundo donax TaxID=35708 RepID=A0A0A9GVH8_ARUDO